MKMFKFERSTSTIQLCQEMPSPKQTRAFDRAHHRLCCQLTNECLQVPRREKLGRFSCDSSFDETL